MYLTQHLHKAVREHPESTAVVFGSRRRNYAELADRVARLGGALRKLGLRPGDRVGMLALNSDRYVEFFYGVWWAGGVINPVNVRWSPREIAYSLDDCDTRVLLVDDAFKGTVPLLREHSAALATVIYAGDEDAPDDTLDYETLLAAAEPAPDAGRQGTDLAAIMYTGGTTGLPKGVMLSHANLYTNTLSAVATIPRPRDVVCIQTAPMFHVGGSALTLQIMLRMGTQVVLPGFDEIAMLTAIATERGTETFMVPTMIKRLIEHPRFAEYDVSSLGLVLYGAAPIDSTLLDAALRALPRAEFLQAYGMTELSPAISVLLPWCHRERSAAAKLRSAGTPMPVVEVRIVDPEGRELRAGTVGEITVRGPTVMAGYWNKPDETAAVLRDGWMHTGDGGYLDSDGFVYVVDRIKDMIVTGGENVYSAEVENAIAQLPEVSMCAVIGVPDERWGERVHAIVALRPDRSIAAETIIAHCRALIAGYKCPRSVEFRDALPLSAAGKLQKHLLRAEFWRGRERPIG